MDSGPQSVLILILLYTFFVSAKIAFDQLPSSDLEGVIENQQQKNIKLQRLNTSYKQLSLTTKLGEVFIGALLLIYLAQYILIVVNQVEVYSNRLIIGIAMLVGVAYIRLVFEALLKKMVKGKREATTVFLVVTPIYCISVLVKPIIFTILKLESILEIKEMASIEKQLVSEEDIKELIIKGEESGIINEIAKDILCGVFKFNDKVATEIMIPRVEAVLIDIEDSMDKIVEKVLKYKFSRIPIYKKSRHNIIGILPTKDFFEEALKVGVNNVDIEKLLKPAYFVPETKAVETLFKELQYTHNSMAVLIDEYGDFSGLVTMQNIVEEIMGDLADDSIAQYQEISKVDEDTFIVDGLTHIEDINEYFNLDIQCKNFDTIGGFVVNLLGNIPQNTQHASVSYQGIVFEVQQVKSNRVDKLKIYVSNHLAVS